MDMKQYPAKKRNRKQCKSNHLSGDKAMNTQNVNDEVKDILNKSNEEKQALIEYAGLHAAFEVEVKRVLGKNNPGTAEEVMVMAKDTKCKEAMDKLSLAHFTFVEEFGYSPEFTCTVVDAIPAVQELAALSVEGLFKPKLEESNMTEAKEVVKEVAEATNDAVETATKAVEATADAITDTVDSAKVVAIEAIEEADEAVETVTAKVEETVAEAKEAVKAESGEEVSIDLVIEEAPKKRELSEEEKAQIKAEAETKAKADVARLTEEARRSQNPITAAWDFIKSPFSKA